MDPRQVIIEPVVSEKSYALMADGKYTFRVDDRAHKTQIRHAVEIFGVGVIEVRTIKVLEAEAPRAAQRPRDLEEGDRPARARRSDRAVRGRGGGRVGDLVAMRKPTSPRRRFATTCKNARRSRRTQQAAQTVDEGKGRSAGATHAAITARHRGGRRSAAIARSTSSAARTASRRRWRRSIRPEPDLLHRPAPLRRWRQELHPGPAGSASRRPGGVGRGADIRPGSALPLRAIPTGTVVHNVELVPGQGGKLGGRPARRSRWSRRRARW